MNSPRKPRFWIMIVFFLLAFIAGAIVIGISTSAADSVFVLPAFIGIFLLTAAFYLSPAYPWFSRPGFPRLLGTILILVVPAMLLHIWMAFVWDYRVAPLVWFAPFMGMGVGLNFRAMREKSTS
ncbi:MAG: hypothetical protein WBM17_06120 [Anaerolineales bacterium]